MDYPQILAPVLDFLHCPTPNAWIEKARDPAMLPLLLTDHMICELKAAQTAMLLVRKYVADKAGSDALLEWLKPYEASLSAKGRNRILSPCINRSAKASCRRPTMPGDASLSTAWCC